MPRVSRHYSELKVYHVILRGIDKQDIFFDDFDKMKFLKEVTNTKEKYNYDIYAYCLMSNHVHLVLYDKENKLSKIMQSLEVVYSIYFNKRYDRVGHLFQNRFLSKVVEDRVYFMQVCRYIHKNPLKAGIAKTEEYKWSSYNEYLFNKPNIINPKMFLSIFSKNLKEAQKEYKKFHGVNNQEDSMYELVEYEQERHIEDDIISEYICKKFNLKNIKEILKIEKYERNKILKECKQIKAIKVTQLARVTGINKKIIYRI